MGCKLVTIGLPVFNGEKYIELSLESLLNQDYDNIEILISDNASTDATKEICAKYMTKDSRIKYFRQTKNTGACHNFEFVLEIASGKYFMWAAHDDLWHQEYVSKCVNLLENDKTIDFCYSKFKFIDKNGEFIDKRISLLDTNNKSHETIFREWVSKTGWYEVYALYRTDFLRRFKIQEVFGSDVLIVLNMLFSGKASIVKEELFYYRIIPKTVTDYSESLTIDTQKKESIRNKPYTSLAKNILKLISEHENTKKEEDRYKEMFFDIILKNNTMWLREILIENYEEINNTYLFFNPKYLEKTLKLILENNLGIERDCDYSSITSNQRPLLIWGAGNGGKLLFDTLGDKSKYVTGFIDKDINKIGSIFHNLPVYSLEILSNSMKKPFVIIGPNFIKEQSQILINNEYKEYDDFVIIFFEDSYSFMARFFKFNVDIE